jgi:GNAT superfamily N-acetyltransferase
MESSDPTLHFRPIVAADVEPLFEVRAAVRENALSRAQLARLGITPESTTAALGRELAGVLRETPARIVGFALANMPARELAVIAVLPDFEGRGIGRELLRRTEEILWHHGCDSIWLWTGTNRATRAVHLYKKCGWTEREVKGDRLYLAKSRPPQPPGPAS